MRTETQLLAIVTLIFAAPAFADEAYTRNWRAEAGLFVQSWPALTDLRPSEGGSFDSVGLGIQGSAHWPVKQWPSSRLLIGADVAIGATESSTRGVASDLMARQFSLGPSLRWEFGDKHPLSLNAGFAWYLLDISEAEFGFAGSGVEVEYWETSTVVPFVGISMDRDLGRKASLTFGLKVHMADFGRVYDEDPFTPPALGPNAGNLDGAMLQLYLGSAFR